MLSLYNAQPLSRTAIITHNRYHAQPLSEENRSTNSYKKNFGHCKRNFTILLTDVNF